MNFVVSNIEKIRKKKGITKTHIARHCGKSVSWYGDISKGRRRLYLDDLLTISDALDEEVTNFFDKNLSETRKSKFTA